MDCKIIYRLFFLIIFLTSTNLKAIEFKGKFLQGHYIIGITDPLAKIIIDNFLNLIKESKSITHNSLNDDQKTIELLEDISRDLINYDLEFRIQELESKFAEDFNQNTFDEINRLKKEQNIN